jgi:chromate transporter
VASIAAPSERRTVSLLEIAWVFAHIASVAFGGASVAMMRREVVRRGWMTEQKFMEIYSIAQISPGGIPISIAVLIGRYLAGTPGFVVAFFAETVPGFVFLMAMYLISLDPRMHVVRSALHGCAAAAVGLMLANALEMSLPWRKSVVHVAIIAAVAVTVLIAHFSLWMTLLVFVPLTIGALRLAGVRR